MRDQQLQSEFSAGIDDVVIVPLAAAGVAVKTVLRWAWSLLVHIVDYAFPIFLQVARFFLFTFRIVGDGVSALLRFVIKYLPLPQLQRQQWREAVARTWSWIRRKVSYRAFEEWLHHLFEDGMAWVFRTCSKLSPTGALLVILGALVWIPVSFLAATAVHGWLIAKAASLPAWMQVFHGVATVLAKTKLLMLPVYPAAWPQAKQHPLVRALARAWRFIVGLRAVRKFRFRFGRIEAAMDRTAERIGLTRLWWAIWDAIGAATAGIVNGIRAVTRPLARRLARVPIAGSVIRTYAAHYDRAGEARPQRLSEKIRDFFERWQIKFTPAYYEAKASGAAASPVSVPPPAAGSRS